jgi:hypothetical protein
MRHLHARFAPLTVLIAVLALAAPAHARSESQTPGAGTAAPGATASDAADLDGLTTGSIGLTPAEKRQRRFEDCMNIWEPATHMTKRQWQRTCKSQLDEVPNL